MLVPGIFKLGRVLIMLQIWHINFMLFIVIGKGWCSGDSCLDEHLFRFGGCLCLQRVVLLNKCLDAGMLL